MAPWCSFSSSERSHAAASWKELGASGSVGLLAEIGLTIWLAPTTAAGVGLIIVVSIAFSLAIGAAIARSGAGTAAKGADIERGPFPSPRLSQRVYPLRHCGIHVVLAVEHHSVACVGPRLHFRLRVREPRPHTVNVGLIESFPLFAIRDEDSRAATARLTKQQMRERWKWLQRRAGPGRG